MFETFHVKQLEDAGLRKIPQHLADYYRPRRHRETFGFMIPKPTSVVNLTEQCYRTHLPFFQKGNLTCFTVECREYQENYAFTISLY